MQFNYRYRGNSRAHSDSAATELSFIPDSLRPPAFFTGRLRQQLAFREAISALHQVVISDHRFQPKDRTEYQRWLAAEEERLLAEFIGRKAAVEAELGDIRRQLRELNRDSAAILKPYYTAQNQYFRHLFVHDRDAWLVLDPVITVHPDQVFFEGFSEDESSYGKLSCGYEVFDRIGDTAFGTTNIDYSEGLYNEFQKIRDYRQTRLSIDPEGFSVRTAGSDDFDEKKIDLPESWVRGFLQVSSAMTLPAVEFDLQPMDIHNLCYRLRRKKETAGPRAMRFELEPDKPVRVVFEPWGDEVVCPRSLYGGAEARRIRVWGRRRLHILERLIPVASGFRLRLIGDGLPSFYVADLGDMSFTLGLSGWTANDWSRLGHFDLLAPRAEVDELTLRRVYKALRETWRESGASLAARLHLEPATVGSALAAYSQRGQVLYDLADDTWRIRELSREPLPLETLRFSSERERRAADFVRAGLVTVQAQTTSEQGLHLRGEVLDNAARLAADIHIDADQCLRAGACQCHFHHHNQLRKGPCEHMLALRMAAARDTKSVASDC